MSSAIMHIMRFYCSKLREACMFRRLVALSVAIIVACGGSHDTPQTTNTNVSVAHTIKVYDVTHGNELMQFGETRLALSNTRTSSANKSQIITKGLSADAGISVTMTVGSGPSTTALSPNRLYDGIASQHSDVHRYATS